MFKKLAFTLAEVLITIGVIGVVAAITIPSLITSYQKHVVETKLEKFNSMMNQALRLSIAENGDPEDWIEIKNNSYNSNLEFLKTYFLPYMKYVRVSQPSRNRDRVQVELLDGTLMIMGVDRYGGNLDYYINGKLERSPRNSFSFQFLKMSNYNTNDQKGTSYVEPYIFSWNNSVTQLKSGSTYSCYKGCTDCAFCTKLIQLNGWKIPKDYPW